RGPDPDQQADDPQGSAGPDLQDRGGEVRGGRRRHRRAVREGSAGAGRYHERRALRVPGQAADEAGHPARGAERQAARAGGVERLEYLSKLLMKRGIPHEVLNAKQHEREALIVAKAGRKGAVTVATNMAGRGTDIVLGGNPEILADQALRERGLDPVENPEEY